MFRFLFLRLILPLIAFWIIRAVFKTLVGMLNTTAASSPAPREAPSAHSGGELKKDPVCGTFVSPQAALARTVGNQVLYFCSAECRDKYRV